MEAVTLDRALFAGAAAVALAGAVGVGLARQPLRAALALMAHLLGMAGLFLLLGAALVAVAQVLVYAGAVMVLFVFVIMILGRGAERRAGASPARTRQKLQTGLAILGGVILAGVIGFAATTLPGTAGGPEGPPLRAVAMGLIVEYLVPFEVVSVLLLSVMVGVVVLARES